jgi:hypothetical protein
LERTGDSPAVLTHGPWRRGRLRARLLRWSLAAVLVAGVGLAVIAGLRWYKRAMLANDVDHLHQHVLVGGDLNAAYSIADPRFQALCPREVFLDYARRRPAVFDRRKLTGVELVWMKSKDDTVVVLRARVDEGETEDEVSFYCTQGTFGFRLLGVSPGLAAAVPRDLTPLGRN